MDNFHNSDSRRLNGAVLGKKSLKEGFADAIK